VEEIWVWDLFKGVSDLGFIHHEVSVSVVELDVVEVTIDGIITSSSSEVEFKFRWWFHVSQTWDSYGFIGVFTNKGGIDFVL